MPERIQLRRTPGWRKPPDAIVVARPTRWGNPWTVGQEITVTREGVQSGIVGRYDPDDPRWFDLAEPDRLTAEQAVALYREELVGGLEDWHPENDELRAALAELAGYDLACWCRLGEPCHADVLLELANPPRGR